MKIFQFNLFAILIFLVIVSLLVLVPSFIVESLWNSFYSINIERDMTIELWQAALLWGACLAAIYMTGIFKFKIDFKTLESLDINQIDDPELKAEIEKLKEEARRQDQEDKE